jgi:hypothetical protein
VVFYLRHTVARPSLARGFDPDRFDRAMGEPRDSIGLLAGSARETISLPDGARHPTRGKNMGQVFLPNGCSERFRGFLRCSLGMPPVILGLQQGKVQGGLHALTMWRTPAQLGRRKDGSCI